MAHLSGDPAVEHAACHHHHGPITGPVPQRRLSRIATVHAITFALQGLLLALLLDLGTAAAVGLCIGFAVLGIVMAGIWRRWTTMPHWFDMCFSMCTLGAFAMYLGIWTDHRFGPLRGLESLFWTYGFMLVGCNLAMLGLTRCPHTMSFTNVAFLAMVIGGNVGMVAGMKAAVLIVKLLVAAEPLEQLWILLGMAVGMVVGMLVGNAVALLLGRKLVRRFGRSRTLPRPN